MRYELMRGARARRGLGCLCLSLFWGVTGCGMVPIEDLLPSPGDRGRPTSPPDSASPPDPTLPTDPTGPIEPDPPGGSRCTPDACGPMPLAQQFLCEDGTVIFPNVECVERNGSCGWQVTMAECPAPPECGPGECGMPPMLAPRICPDGTLVVPDIRCEAKPDGVCGWSFLPVVCPTQGTCSAGERPCPTCGSGFVCTPLGVACPLVQCPPPTIACGGPSSLVCPKNMYCDFEDNSCGAAGQFGECNLMPDTWIEIYAPVCGCDNVSYGNAYEAHGNGVDVQYAGLCAGPCGPGLKQCPDCFGETFCGLRDVPCPVLQCPPFRQ